MYIDIFSVDKDNSPSAFLEPYHPELMLVLATLGIVTGAFIYAFMDAKLERKKEEIQMSLSLLLKLLDPNQRKIILHLWKSDGAVNQREFARLEGMDKLKVHRALKMLELKDIVTIEKYGKINKVILQKDVLAVYKKEKTGSSEHY